MNQRLNHEDEQLRRQQICEILDLCLQINGIQKSRSELTGNHPTASYEFDGHIGWISVRIYTEGWTEGKSPDKALRGYITRPDEIDQMIRELRELKRTCTAATVTDPDTLSVDPDRFTLRPYGLQKITTHKVYGGHEGKSRKTAVKTAYITC